MVITHKTEQKQPKITSAMQRTLAAKLFWEKKVTQFLFLIISWIRILCI